MNKILFIMFSLISYIGIAQNVPKPIIYVDEEMQLMNEADYSLQLLKSLYREDIIERDTVTIKKLRSLFEFDSLSQGELIQVQGIFKKYLNVNDFKKNILIVYRDSLLGYEEFIASTPQKRAYDAMDINSEKKYLERRINFDSKQKKCVKFANKNGINIIYGYSGNQNFTFQPKHYKNTKIPSVLKSLFFKNRISGNLLLKPDGNYFFYSYLTEKQLLRMLNSDWETYIQDYKAVKSNDAIFTIKFIEEMNKERHEDITQRARKQANQIYKRRSNSPRDYSTRKFRINQPRNCYGYASY